MSEFPRHLLRPDLRTFAGYSSARTSFTGPPARIWLNANEAAEPNSVDPDGRSRRYPPPQPTSLRGAFAAYLGARDEQVLLARGSDEAIDVLVRALCRPGSAEGIVVCSPTFGMYAVSAVLHGVPSHDAPQQDTGNRFEHDLEAVAKVVRATGARIVFLASPGNPSGSVIEIERVLTLARDLAGVAVVVLDEAYGEFASQGSAIDHLDNHPTLAVLRTMSKAHGLAGARVGALVAHPDLVSVVSRVQAPYPMPGPVVDLALRALQEQSLTDTHGRVAATRDRRDRLAEIISAHPDVTAVYDSEANFVLARSGDVDELLRAVVGHGIAIRDMRHLPGLHDAIRISVGTDDEIDALSQALAQSAEYSAQAEIPTETSERTR